MPRPVLGNYDGAVVSGFFVFGIRSGGGLAPPYDLTIGRNAKATLLYVAVLIPPPYDTQLASDAVRRWSPVKYPVTRASQSRERGRNLERGG